MVTLWRLKQSFWLNMLSFATRPEPEVGLFTTKLHLTSIFSRAEATNGNITQGYEGLLLVGKSRIKILGADDFQVYSSKETTSG